MGRSTEAKYTQKTCDRVVVRKEESIYTKTARERAPVHLSPIAIKGIIERTFEHAVAEANRHGECKIAGMLNLKLKSKPATPARKGVNPFTKEPCVFKAKPASKTVKALPMKKLQTLVN